MKSLVFTGGGSSGHVTPNLALIAALREQYDIHYFGSQNGIEKNLIERVNIPYYSISTGKLRRHLSWRNLVDPFNVLLGISQAWRLCRKLKPQLVFSKGGFVAVPVVIAAWLNRIPVIIHESDTTPGLANKICQYFAKTICINFPITQKYIKLKHKVKLTGSPIRSSLLQGTAEQAWQFLGEKPDKPLLLIIGGGLGAKDINEVVFSNIDIMCDHFTIVHLCGDKHIHHAPKRTDYFPYAYLHDELADILAAATIVISRAGANSIYELISLAKPHILLPLGTQASRGDQIKNADYFQSLGLSQVIYSEQLDGQRLLHDCLALLNNLEQWQQKLQQYQLPNATEEIITLIQQTLP